MLSKCANPTCAAPFHYLRDGKLFQIDSRFGTRASPSGPQLLGKKPAGRIEYFWLCNACSSTMTLAYERGKGVVAVPLVKAPTPEAVAS